MIYKINTEKKDEFIKWNYKQLLKNQLPIYIPFLIIADIIMLIIFPIGFADIKSLIPFIILATNIIFIFVYFVFSFLGVKISSKKLDEWELDIQANYAILKNPETSVRVDFADFKKYKEEEDSITFYFKGLRCFYINWNCFLDSENLKLELKKIAGKIGNFIKEELSDEEKKEVSKIKLKFTFLYILFGVLLVLRILSILL